MFKPALHQVTSFLNVTQIMVATGVGLLLMELTDWPALSITLLCMAWLVFYCHVKNYTVWSLTMQAAASLKPLSNNWTAEDQHNLLKLCMEMTNTVLQSSAANTMGPVRALDRIVPWVVKGIKDTKPTTSQDVLSSLHAWQSRVKREVNPS